MKRLNSLTYKKLDIGHGTLTYAVDIISSADYQIGVQNSIEYVVDITQTPVTYAVDITQAPIANAVYIIEYSGHDTSIEIPETIEDYPVVAICKKAFLSNKTLREVMLPNTIKEIDDFCFARCSNLKRVGLPYSALKLGMSVFLDCDSLEEIINVSEDVNDRKVEDVGYLLAATAGILEAPYLFDLERAGHDEWFHQWDMRMLSKMDVDDSEGFSKMLLCGEEDYGSNETNPDYFKHLKRLSKCRVAILRLMHDTKLDEKIRDNLKKYLLGLVKGCRHEETWDVVFREHGDDKSYYEFLTSLGGVTKENLFDMLTDMGDRHPEMKAYLMKYIDSQSAGEDAFGAFEL